MFSTARLFHNYPYLGFLHLRLKADLTGPLSDMGYLTGPSILIIGSYQDTVDLRNQCIDMTNPSILGSLIKEVLKQEDIRN